MPIWDDVDGEWDINAVRPEPDEPITFNDWPIVWDNINQVIRDHYFRAQPLLRYFERDR